MATHDAELAKAFDAQAARFERSPVQSDPSALARLVAFAALPPDSLVLDAGCGPGLVSEALLGAGHRVHGVDLSAEMVRRARERCARFGGRARFDQGSVFELDFDEWFDRGTPAAGKAQVRQRLLAGRARGFAPRSTSDGRISIRCVRSLARGVREGPTRDIAAAAR